MLAVNHITFATATTLGVSVYTGQPFFLPFIFFVSLSALVPDVDHPKSELGRVLILPGRILKHRGVTHSFLGFALFGGLLYASQFYPTVLRYIFLIAAYFGSLFLVKALSQGIKSGFSIDPTGLLTKTSKLVVTALTTIIHFTLILSLILIWNNQLYREILLLCGIGYILHVVGDAVTKEGVPLLWPSKQKFGLHLFRTGKLVESILGVLFVILNGYFLYQFFVTFEVLNTDYWLNYLTFLQ
jgi:membrane-bound metal-dependent hydrolase YbcI (DUF457 family)